MSHPLKNSSQRIKEVLVQFGLHAEIIEFRELTRTAQEAATAIGCEVGQIAKTLIFKGKHSSQPICVIASGKNRVDEKKVARSVQEDIEKPNASFVLQHTGFIIGGVPPIGFHFDSPPLIDEDLMHYSEIWAAAGNPHSVFKLSPQDLLRITIGHFVDVKIDK